MNVNKHPFQPRFDELVAQARDEGYTAQEIAEDLGCGIRMVWAALGRLEVEGVEESAA